MNQNKKKPNPEHPAGQEEKKESKKVSQRSPIKRGIDQVVKDAIARVMGGENTDTGGNKGALKPARENTKKATGELAQKPKRPKPKKQKSVAAAEAGAETARKPRAHKTAPTAGEKQEKPAKKAVEKKKATAKTSAKKSAGKGTKAAAKTAKPAKTGKKAVAAAIVADPTPGKKSRSSAGKLKLIPLGGLGEVGKNMMVIQYGDDMIVADCGMSFPVDGMFGVDLVIPDYSYLQEHRDNVQAIVLTHGHEDHIGALPYVLRDINVPVYGSPLTLGLVRGKLAEHRIQADLRTVAPREEVNIGPFKVEFIRLTHSIPDALGLAIHTPIGVVLLISDFKMDMSPIDGQLMDFGRISALGEKGVLLLMSDSTNAEQGGFTNSERTVGHTFDKVMMDAKGRVIVTTFASHVHRIQQTIWAANRAGRKVAVTGRGMQNIVNITSELGYLEIPSKCLIDVEKTENLPASKVCILTTGSQGEQMAALTRIAAGEHRQVQIVPGDTVVVSATPIPGNERSISRTVDNLFRMGANVVYERQQNIHVSGHASREELKVLLNMVKPRFFLPIHGEYRMLYKHALLAQEVGMPLENTVVMENGQVLELTRRSCNVVGEVPHGRILIDGLGVGDVGATVLRERKQLSEGGMIVVSMVYTRNKGGEPAVLNGPNIETHGFIFTKENGYIIDEMKTKVEQLATPERLADGSLADLRNQVRTAVGRVAMERTGRKPMVMAVISEV